jgi:hypothetical protein
MESSEGQLALIEVWADGTDFEVDNSKTPKANFAGLAKARGWVGGDANWRGYWQACFNEPYLFGRRGWYIVVLSGLKFLTQYDTDELRCLCDACSTWCYL